MADAREAALEILKWYREAGVDEAVGEGPSDWSRLGAPAALTFEADAEAAFDLPPRREAPASPPQPIARAQPAMPLDASALTARELARQAGDIAALEAALVGFDGCGLKKTAKHLCFARGNPKARLMLIGEAPGRDEDLEGRPFVGRAGKLLDKMLAAIALTEADVYITNTVYWRPPGNRTPTPEEVEACAPFLARQIELLSPHVLVLLGGAAAKNILGVVEGIMRLRGKWLNYASSGRDIPTLATLHPAFLLRNPEHKRLAWRDLLMVKERLNQQ
jgi:uracil-DNA glycosylase